MLQHTTRFIKKFLSLFSFKLVQFFFNLLSINLFRFCIYMQCIVTIVPQKLVCVMYCVQNSTVLTFSFSFSHTPFVFGMDRMHMSMCECVSCVCGACVCVLVRLRATTKHIRCMHWQLAFVDLYIIHIGGLVKLAALRYVLHRFKRQTMEKLLQNLFYDVFFTD